MRKMSEGRIEFYKEHYPRGTRVQLDLMSALSAPRKTLMIRVPLSPERSEL